MRKSLVAVLVVGSLAVSACTPHELDSIMANLNALIRENPVLLPGMRVGFN
jgi:hypothetical protein